MALIAPPTRTLVLALSQSVGIKGKNLAPDVIRVQDALNTIPASAGAPATLLSLDGKVGPKTSSAIQQLQLRHFGWKGADGRIDPGGRTAQLISALLLQHGSTHWNIRRIEAATPATGNVADVRTINSRDRFFLIHDASGARRALYYCVEMSNVIRVRELGIPPLVDRPEFNMFSTACPCSAVSMIGWGTYAEFARDENHTTISLTIQPTAAHVANGSLTFHINHQWIKPTSTPGTRIHFPAGLQFVRDESAGERKVPRR
jgi:hypothetical protein